MKAFVIISPENGHVDLREVNIPEIDNNEVLVKVAAFGVGIHDRYFIPQGARFPYPIGTEASGFVVKVGNRVNAIAVGDRVILSSGMQLKGGCWAEYVAVSSNNVIRMVDEMDFPTGASLPIAGKTALESMYALNLKNGDKLFIAGASGAIGTIVIQLAVNAGIRVISSASSKNHEYMRSLGAEAVVDYSDPHWKKQVIDWAPHGVDAALAIQPGTGEDSIDIVRDEGKVITVSGDVVRPSRGIIIQQFQHQLNLQSAIGYLVDEIKAGRIKIVLGHIYTFEDALIALELTETRHAREKRVVSM